MTRTYLIAYTFWYGEGDCIGRRIITRDTPIATEEDVLEIELLLEARLISFQRLEQPE
jgi:hypothetical protein